MKCQKCTNSFFIRTNIEKRCFDYVKGIKQKYEEFDTLDAKSLGVIDTEYGHAIHNFTKGSLDVPKGAPSVIDRLEKEMIGQRKVMSDIDAMNMLMKHNNSTMYDDSSSNSKLRQEYRMARNTKKRKLTEAQSLGLGKGIMLDDFRHQDIFESQEAFQRKNANDTKAKLLEKKKFQSIQRGIFQTNKADTFKQRSKPLLLQAESCQIKKETENHRFVTCRTRTKNCDSASRDSTRPVIILSKALKENSTNVSSLMTLLDYESESSNS
jgi:hypothetical protein